MFPPCSRSNRPRFSNRIQQRDRYLPELGGGGQAPVEGYDMGPRRLGESDQIAVGDRFRSRLEGKGSNGLPELGLGAAGLRRELP